MNRFKDGMIHLNRNYGGTARVPKSDLRSEEREPTARLAIENEPASEAGTFYLDYQEIVPAELQRDSDAW